MHGICFSFLREGSYLCFFICFLAVVSHTFIWSYGAKAFTVGCFPFRSHSGKFHISAIDDIHELLCQSEWLACYDAVLVKAVRRVTQTPLSRSFFSLFHSLLFFLDGDSVYCYRKDLRRQCVEHKHINLRKFSTLPKEHR